MIWPPTEPVALDDKAKCSGVLLATVSTLPPLTSKSAPKPRIVRVFVPANTVSALKVAPTPLMKCIPPTVSVGIPVTVGKGVLLPSKTRTSHELDTRRAGVQLSALVQRVFAGAPDPFQT